MKMFLFPSCRQTRTALFATAVSFSLLFIQSGVAWSSQPTVQAHNAIQAENQMPGTTAWQLVNPALNGELQAYADADSIDRGGTFHLYVSAVPVSPNTTSPVRIDIYRLGYYSGLGGRLMKTVAAVPAESQGHWSIPPDGKASALPEDCPTCITTFKDSLGQETNIRDANWNETTTLTFLPDWISGIYLLKLTDIDTSLQWQVPLVVRDDAASADIVFQDPVNTDQAYNAWGGTSLYQNYAHGPGGDGASYFDPLAVPTSANSLPPRAYYASWNRPFVRDAGAGHLFYWTYSMLRFFEEMGYDVAYTTNNAVASGATKLLHYKAFISAGHDEYWSQDERFQLQTAIQHGVNVAFFGADSMYWQVRPVEDFHGRANRIIACYKQQPGMPVPQDPDIAIGPLNVPVTTSLWRWAPVSDPESDILGVLYGGYLDTLSDYVVTNTQHWMYADSKLKDGDKIPSILGYEVDFLQVYYQLHTGDTIVGDSPNALWRGNTAKAIIREFGFHGAPGYHLIFTAGTIFWPAGLTDFPSHWSARQIPPESQPLRTITSNILNRMIEQVGWRD